jgi:hypothetical protein
MNPFDPQASVIVEKGGKSIEQRFQLQEEHDGP